MKVQLKIIDGRYHEEWGLPRYAHPHDAGIDLRASTWHPITLGPGGQIKVHTGLAIYIRDPAYVGIIAPRSSMGSQGLILGNTIGVIDSNYQGEIVLCMWNRSNSKFTILPGAKLAQLLVIPVANVDFELVDKFEESDRGEKGFGSTDTINV